MKKILFGIAIIVTLAAGMWLLIRTPEGFLRFTAEEFAAIEKLKSDSIHGEVSLQFQLLIHNNPFEFDSTWSMTIVFNGVLIYTGKFQPERIVNVPRAMADQRIRPRLLIDKGDLWFDGWKKEPHCFTLTIDSLHSHNNFLNIVFLPENTAPSSYLMFTGWVR